MSAEILEIDSRIARFDQRNSSAGLLRRYARGRVKYFASRQVLTLSGAMSLFVLASLETGLLAVLVALFGEGVDCLVLRRLPVMMSRGLGYRAAFVISTITAAIQAATIAFCVCLAWFTAPGGTSMFFCLAYLTGAAINGGIILPFHRGAALARLTVYALTFAALFIIEIRFAKDASGAFLYNLFGGIIMFYMVYVFLLFVSLGHKRETENSRNLLKQGLALASANNSLQAQQAELRRLALVAERALDSVIVSDPNGRILWVNDAFTRISGYTASEVIGRKPAEVLNGPETSLETSDAIAAAIQDGRPYRAELINATKDGRNIWIETNLTPVFDDTGKMEMVIAIERDITLAKEHQRELADAKAAAEQGEQVKADFLASMSHEIRTPMNGIIGMSDLLAESDLSEENQLYVHTIRHSAEALLTIINDILDFSKLRAGKMKISPVVFDLPTCLREVANLMRPQAHERGISLELKTGEGVPRHVRGDDIRLRQILVNVLGNAIKFTVRGGVHVAVEAVHFETQIKLDISVSDTGIGIPEDRLDHIFEQFAQADAATTRRFGGTGLGLAISRRLARRMGGDIRVTSKVGRGSVFNIAVVLQAVADDEGPPSSEGHVGIDPENLVGLTVLLAEDNRTNRLVIRKLLQDQPLTLLTAHDGRQAVAMAARHHPDIVLMDMSMPEMDGIDASRAIRRLPGLNPRIVALTANAYQSDRDACLEAGMDAFLTKPVRKAQLLRELSQVARKPPLEKDLG